MSIESDIDTALGGFVDNRVHANRFPQQSQRPAWPAIRRTTISSVPAVDICGDGGDETADVRVQLDLVVSEAAGDTALRTLRAQVMSAMTALDPPTIWDGERNEFDEETRTHRCSLDYVFYPSSDSGDSPP